MREFEQLSQNAMALTKLCVITIRQNLPCKTDEDFDRLGLPPALISLVKLSNVAEEIALMWSRVTLL